MEEHEIKIEEEVIVVEVSAIGERGPQGEQGPTGATPNISVNSTTTLPAGSSATVELDASSTAENPKFNFGIPKGDAGEVTQAEFDALEDEVNDLYNNQIEGTATGTNINITDSANVRTKSLALDGRCTQGANPSPDNPQEIKVVKAENIFNEDNFISSMAPNIQITKTTYQGEEVLYVNPQNATTTYYNLSLKANTQYTLSLKVASAIGTGDAYIGFKYTDNTSSNINVYNLLPSLYTPFKITSTAGKTIQSISLVCYNNADNKYYFKDIQLEENIYASPYVPYGCIQGKICGKNLLNLTNGTKTQNGITFTHSNGTTTMSGTATNESNVHTGIGLIRSGNYINYVTIRETSAIKLPAGTYTFSITNSNSNLSYQNVSLIVGDINQSKNTGATTYSLYQSVLSQTFTLTEEKYAMPVYYLYGSNANGVSFENIMLEKSSTVTTYEGYKENVVNINLNGNELYSLPNGVKDELVIQNGIAKIIKKIGKAVLDGTEGYATWGLKDTDYFSAYVNKLIPNPAIINDTIISTHFPYSNYTVVANATNIGCFTGGNYIGISVPKNILSDTSSQANAIASLKTWLSSANPTFYYLLATPTEINLGAVTQPKTYKTTSNISNNKDTNMSLTYYKDLEKLISDIQTAIVSLS